MDETTLIATLLAVLLYRRRTHRRLQQRASNWRPSYEYLKGSFSLDLMSPGRARVWLRFTVPEIQRLAPLLHLDEISYRNGYSCDPTTALCVVCARLSYPGRWYQHADLFKRSPSWLSTIFNDTIQFLTLRFANHLRWHPQMTRYSTLKRFADAVQRVGGVEGVYGFVDGTFRGHCRPSGPDAQRTVYSGHKRAHGLNWQAIVTPDGLVSSLVGPFAGANNDWSMWKRSGCEEDIRKVMAGKETLYIYGNPAYNSSFGVACPFKHPYGRRYLSRAQQEFNRSLSTVRIAVEQAFGDVQVQWTYTAFSKALTAGLQPVAAHFVVAVVSILTFIEPLR
jgi:DDE superfamily endonuclease